MPDHIKDHGFLALTKADRQLMKGDLTDRIAALDDFVCRRIPGAVSDGNLAGHRRRGAKTADSHPTIGN